MSFVLRSLLVFAAVTCCVQQLAEGQIRQTLKQIFCHRCNCYSCGCPQPLLTAPAHTAACVPPATQTVGGPIAQSCTKTCTTVHPVVETRYRREQYTTCRTECRTAVRKEAYCQTVPVTCVENVTRDEGCYKLVWVPKPVTRQVPKTVYRQRVAYRDVPYQYTVQVPEVKTRIVPEQTVRYVQKTQTFTEPMQPVGCAAPMFGPAPEQANYPPPIVPNCGVPNHAVPPGAAAQPQNLTSDNSGSPWTRVPQRTAAQPQAAPTPVASQAPQQTAQVQHQTPTAAAVWQYQR